MTRPHSRSNSPSWPVPIGIIVVERSSILEKILSNPQPPELTPVVVAIATSGNPLCTAVAALAPRRTRFSRGPPLTAPAWSPFVCTKSRFSSRIYARLSICKKRRSQRSHSRQHANPDQTHVGTQLLGQTPQQGLVRGVALVQITQMLADADTFELRNHSPYHRCPVRDRLRKLLRGLAFPSRLCDFPDFPFYLSLALYVESVRRNQHENPGNEQSLTLNLPPKESTRFPSGADDDEDSSFRLVRNIFWTELRCDNAHSTTQSTRTHTISLHCLCSSFIAVVSKQHKSRIHCT